MHPLEELSKNWVDSFAETADLEEATGRFLSAMEGLSSARAAVLALDVLHRITGDDSDRATAALAWARYSLDAALDPHVRNWCEQFLDSADLRDSVAEWLDDLDQYSSPAAAALAWSVLARLQEEDPDLASAVLGWARRAWKAPVAMHADLTIPNVVAFRRRS